MRKRLQLAFAILLVMCSSAAVATEYAALPFSAKVVDKETGKPIEGAVAYVIWELNYYTGHSGGPALYTAEAISDSEGVFRMPGWGPLPVPREKLLAPLVMDPNQPGLYVFKAGYEIYAGNGPEDNRYIGNPIWTGDLVRTVWADGTTIKLIPAPDSQQYARIFDAQSPMALYGCLWAKNPRMTAALVTESNRLQAAHPEIEWRFHWAHFDRAPANECGNPREILEPYLK